MTARDALLDKLGHLKGADVAAGMALVAAWAGAERYLVSRCDGLPENDLSNVVASDWPFDLVRGLGVRLIRNQGKLNELERCLTTLQPSLETCGRDVRLEPGISRRYCVVPFNGGSARMILAFLFREAVTLSQERLGDAALMTAYLVDAPPEHAADRPLDLTDREIECLAWIAEGKTSDEVSMIIGISRNTVNNYITSIMRKTATRTRSETIALAVRKRLI